MSLIAKKKGTNTEEHVEHFKRRSAREATRSEPVAITSANLFSQQTFAANILKHLLKLLGESYLKREDYLPRA
jgi:hypothetical protein